MFTDSKETELFLIEDNPGLGKSTAPLAAALYQSIGYAVLEPGMDVLKSIEEKFDTVLKAKFPQRGDEESVIREMKDVFLHRLTHVFQKCEALILKKGISLLYNMKTMIAQHSIRLTDHSWGN